MCRFSTTSQHLSQYDNNLQTEIIYKFKDFSQKESEFLFKTLCLSDHKYDIILNPILSIGGAGGS